jgi:hypothetical protein
MLRLSSKTTDLELSREGLATAVTVYVYNRYKSRMQCASRMLRALYFVRTHTIGIGSDFF